MARPAVASAAGAAALGITLGIAVWVGGCTTVAGEPRSASPGPASTRLGTVVTSTRPAAPPKTTAATGTPSSPGRGGQPAPTRTSQGWYVKGIGELAGIGGNGNLAAAPVRFVVDDILVDPPCEPSRSPAGAGYKTVVLLVSMTTGQLEPDEALTARLVFDPLNLYALTPDGYIHGVLPGTCFGRGNEFPKTIGPNGRYGGTVEMQVPADATSIVSEVSSGIGWTWALPAP